MEDRLHPPGHHSALMGQCVAPIALMDKPPLGYRDSDAPPNPADGWIYYPHRIRYCWLSRKQRSTPKPGHREGDGENDVVEILRNGGARGGETDPWAGGTLWAAGRGGRAGWPTLRDTGMGGPMCKGW
ncbi:hypothetical protein EYF80_039474 [Liparis tanakae]|uniref:Uncharacterized protein n=1 Tax=Liparis tanakae TaxID=230148 RepID=A0A4Z2G9W0_9TELE|nr:hypothetical protein EYF80_039474 [Liparis tanakae]